MSADRDLDIFECPSCKKVVLNQSETCCGEQMNSVDVSPTFNPPDTDSIVSEVFGISGTELVVCRTIMSEEETTVKELASQLDLDQSSINRHLNHLVDLGIVEKQPQVLAEGGRVHIYSPVPIDDVRRQFRIGLYGWGTEAAERIEELSEEKIEAMAEVQTDSEADGSTLKKGREGNETAVDEETESTADGEKGSSLVTRLFRRGPLE
ncbi:helix-turn-helix domain-containing protein [Natrinema sp. 74]|uniref:helix-turn-helix domain-containing protein n=1 Tax=Natrinema sp. 74 TaxID=3384159 RepID=UPI0038D49E02